jgi:two-component system chemotaxis sensor kinase CheA
MNNGDTEFLQRLLAIFQVEAREHLDAISSRLSRLKTGEKGGRADDVETAFREAHSLKGAARSVNLPEIVTLCQVMESVFSAVKREHLEFSGPLADTLQQAVDFVYKMLESGELSSEDRMAVRGLIQQLDGIVTGHVALPGKEEQDRKQEKPQTSRPPTLPEEKTVPPPAPAVEPTVVTQAPTAGETVRIAAARLDALLLKAEEMIEIKLAAGQRVSELHELKGIYRGWKEQRRRDEKRQVERSGVAGLLSADHLEAQFETGLNSLISSVENDQRVASSLIDALLEEMKKSMMLPFSSMLTMFSRYLRDLARDTGKEAELTTFGDTIEIDRRVLEEMKDPLIHLVRNSIDHGLETPEERRSCNKAACGKITIGLASRDNWLEITVADDGRGIDVRRLIDTAIRQGVTSPEAAGELDEEQAVQLIFKSGVTTSPIITDISGRGLGLAIVREKVERLSGSVRVESDRERGTTVHIVVPLTLVNFRGTLVETFGRLFVVPSANVERVVRVQTADIKTVENVESILFEGSPLSLVRLGSLLGLQEPVVRQSTAESPFQAVVLRRGGTRMAFLVTEVLREQEVLVKSLGSQLARVKNIAGATILGNGRVVPVLNVADLFKSALKFEFRSSAPEKGSPATKISVLVVEDSITARTLMKNILETAAYTVRTAVDGVDAINALKDQNFNIVVSDVEMPRMNGFDLTARIRADRKLRDLPVVLVTALESREDKERGVDVGANAYIVKSSFDQSNLLEVIGRLT